MTQLSPISYSQWEKHNGLGFHLFLKLQSKTAKKTSLRESNTITLESELFPTQQESRSKTRRAFRDIVARCR